ncbi:DUF2474 family protein [Rhodovibrio salinarum]|uniref:DUF2474 domain-containing protein n=1 Tax=Rhodovibrio salinarum TaxID=1087 RepID=A0A934V0U4_9PROT|nr:DUF2474 family protein [Rhodovibrio salinarum]MBK1698308.1 DUF2474 domain-containing protein [Rhodovibrio salinarum]
MARAKISNCLQAIGVVREDRADPARAGADRAWKRLAWFGVLWAGSVAALSLVGLAIKLALGQ